MNETPPQPGHSEEYFKSSRDFWWNRDFLELMARRLRLAECSTLLDVGCGQCHWSRLLVEFLKKPSQVHALDSDSKWASGSDLLRRSFDSQGATVVFEHGDAHALPYPTDSFDVVTCQTTLIHVGNPKAAIMEMRRVVKPGGLVLCVEPNNVATCLVRSSVSTGRSIEDIIKDVKYALSLERGKALLGEGDNSFGDLLPGVFAEAGFDDIRVYLSDKAAAMFPPYRTPEQQAVLKTTQEWAGEDTGPHDWAQQRRYLAALGSEQSACFEEMQKRQKAGTVEYLQAIERGSYSTGGGCLMYLVSGRKAGQAQAPDALKRTGKA